jgi:hypothetical protein
MPSERATFINIADIVEENGKTIRENNLAKVHGIPLGALVEVRPDDEDDREGGVRAFVVHQGRDCDGTPLYSLSLHAENICWDNVMPQDRYGISQLHATAHGYPEQSLEVIRLPASPDQPER